MPLSGLKTLLEEAGRQGRAVGAFNVASVEMILGCVEAAEEARTPIILQTAEVRLSDAPLDILGPAMLGAARAARVPVAVQLDHGKTEKTILKALDMGFTSIMFDGSSLPMEENIAMTRYFADMAHARGACAEGEIGSLGAGEGGEGGRAACTDPREAALFAARTGVDALAVAIGNAHGVYAGTPDFRFDILSDVSARCSVPLVLHGGTGAGEERFRRCIRGGIRKINIATAFFMADARARTEVGGEDYFAMSRAAREAVRRTAEEHIRIFGIRKEC